MINAVAPFYGRQVSAEDAANTKASLLIHYAENDPRINAGWPACEEALKEAGVNYTMHRYEGVGHVFHNDSTPRYDGAAANLVWKRTIDFFNQLLR